VDEEKEKPPPEDIKESGLSSRFRILSVGGKWNYLSSDEQDKQRIVVIPAFFGMLHR
jgi:hypothetical protein